MPETTAEAAAMVAAVTEHAPKENLVRAARAGVQMRAVDPGTSEAGDGQTLYGHFSVANQWTEIDSWYEGNFLERVAPGAFRKTFKEQRDRIRVLLEHGQDPQIGNKPIAEISDLREDDIGAYYEARLFDGLPQLVMDGLRASQYGASFRFTVIRDEWVQEPGVSDYNPKGLPERTLKEVRISEFGPVTFGAYPNASADVRSLTGELMLGRAVAQPERMRAVLDYLERRDQRTATQTSPGPEGSEENESSERCDEDTADATEAEAQTRSDTAPSDERAARDGHATDERRTRPNHLYGMSRKESRTWSL